MGLLIAAGMAGLCCGCAHSQQQTLNSFWSSVTPRQWSAKPVDTPLEPRVSANVPDAEAPGPLEATERISRPSPTDETSRSWASRFAARPRTQPETPHGPTADPQSSPAASTSYESTTDAGPVASAGRQNSTGLQRLRTALTLGFDGKPEVREPATPGQDQTRFRVENLLTRSRGLAETGELPQARHLAQLAQQMAEESHLEFAPDAQRPVDVIAYLAQLESSAATAPPHVLTTSFSGPSGAAGETTPGVVPSAAVSDAVMRVNQGFTDADGTADVAQPPFAPADHAAGRPTVDDSGVELLTRAEPVRDEQHSFSGVATVRKRFRALESHPAQPAAARSETSPLLGSTSPRTNPQPVTSLTWTWPSPMESQNTAQHRGWSGFTMLLTAACGLLTLAGGVWLAVRRRRPPAR